MTETPLSARIKIGPQSIAALEVLTTGGRLHLANLGGCAQRENGCDAACSPNCLDDGFDRSNIVQIMDTALSGQEKRLSFELDWEGDILVSAE